MIVKKYNKAYSLNVLTLFIVKLTTKIDLMETYILQILEKNNRVIVPEFGAFIVKQRNPLTIVFNEFLQYNDGMLVDYISKTDSISKEEAKGKIDSFIKKVNIEMPKGNGYPLSGLGILTKSAAGKISIKKEGESKKPEKKAAKAPAKTISESPVKEVKAPVKKIAKEEPIAKKQETKVEEKAEIEKKPVEKKPETEVKKVPEEKKEIVRPIEKKEYSLGQTQVVQDVSPNRKRTNIIIWVVIILIANAILIGYWLFNNEINEFLGFKSDKIESLEIDGILPDETGEYEEASLDEVHPEELSPANQKPIETTAPAHKTISSGKRYYVVAGVFSSEQNADNLVIELRKKAYNSEKFGTIGSLHAVSYDVFKNKTDADRLLRQIQQSTDPAAWIRTVK